MSSSLSSSSSSSSCISLIWLRRDLRLHDNVAISHALQHSTTTKSLFFVYCLKVPVMKKCGHVRWRFLIQSLKDLDANLRKLGSRLFVVRGKATDVLPPLVKAWNVTELLVQQSPEPHSELRDQIVSDLISPSTFKKFPGRTLFPLSEIMANSKLNASVPLTMTGFVSLIDKKLGHAMRKAEPTPTAIPPPIPDAIDRIRSYLDEDMFKTISGPNLDFGVPQLTLENAIDELDVPATAHVNSHMGGETVALQRLEQYMQDVSAVRNFEKPKTNPSSIPEQTTGLSPYLTYGCLSPCLFYHRLKQVYSHSKHTQPPVSLMGQLYWREFFFAHSATIPNFEQMHGNKICVNIDWRCGPGSTPESHPQDYADLEKWKLGRTGFPWIDAIMTQLREEGWIHHLARHSVACFLTRGDLYISWEKGAEVFEEYLLDHEWALNRGNWLWLSGTSTFFKAYFRVYSPIKFCQAWDPDGLYIKKYLPQLSKFPKAYIYEPWKAPMSVQKNANCVIGVHYPLPMLDHAEVSKENQAKIKAAFASAKSRDTHPYEDRLDNANGHSDPEDSTSHQSRDRPKCRH